MDNYAYYCKVSRDYSDMKAGIYYFCNRHRFGSSNRLLTISDIVWRQGPRGGVKIIKDRQMSLGYITTNEELMKEFVWVKLQAQELR